MPARNAHRAILDDFCDHPVRAPSGQQRAVHARQAAHSQRHSHQRSGRFLRYQRSRRAERFCPTVWVWLAHGPHPRTPPPPGGPCSTGWPATPRYSSCWASSSRCIPATTPFPGEVFLHLAADALDWCRASRTNPLQLEGLQARFLPELSFRGRQNKKLQYAILAAAALHGGTEPDLLDEVAWWQTDDFWEYALYAAVAYIRAAASHAGVPVRQACQNLAPGRGHPAP
jgi:hypothetical protein